MKPPAVKHELTTERIREMWRTSSGVVQILVPCEYIGLATLTMRPREILHMTPNDNVLMSLHFYRIRVKQ